MTATSLFNNLCDVCLFGSDWTSDLLLGLLLWFIKVWKSFSWNSPSYWLLDQFRGQVWKTGWSVKHTRIIFRTLLGPKCQMVFETLYASIYRCCCVCLPTTCQHPQFCSQSVSCACFQHFCQYQSIYMCHVPTLYMNQVIMEMNYYGHLFCWTIFHDMLICLGTCSYFSVFLHGNLNNMLR